MIESARKADRQAIVFTVLCIGITTVLAVADSLLRIPGAA